MQDGNYDPNYARQQIALALGECSQQLRNAATMIDAYSGFIQTLNHNALPNPPLNMFHMFSPASQTPTVSAPAPHMNGSAPLVITDGNNPVPAAAGRKRRAPPGTTDAPEDKRRRRGEKKEKKPRDPNAPKRPASAYLLFQNEVRKEMQEEFKGKPYREVLGKISERWAQMSEEQKKHYVDMMQESKVRYEADKAAYDKAHTEENVPLPGAIAATPVYIPAVQSVPIPTTTAPTLPQLPVSDDDDDDEESSESSRAVAAAVKQAPAATSDSDTSEVSDDDDDEDNDEEEDEDEDEEDEEPPKNAKSLPTKVGAKEKEKGRKKTEKKKAAK